MIILDSTAKSLKVVLAGAVAATQLPVTTHYTDITTTAYTPGSTDTVTNSGTPVEIVAAPVASTQRHVESISVYNVDTASATVTIQYVSAGGTRQIIKVVLLTLEALFYEDGAGWQVIDANGNVKTAHSPAVPSATAQNDFIVSDSSPFAWVKKTLAQAKALILDAVTLTGGTNTFNLTNGTASLDVAAGVVVNIDAELHVTAATHLDEAVAMSDKAPKTDVVKGDGTAGRQERQIQIIIEDGTTASTLKLTAESLWMGDALAEVNNLAKGTTTGNWRLSADGTVLTYANDAITGNIVAVKTASLTFFSGSIAWTLRFIKTADGIALYALLNSTSAAQDWTVLTDTAYFFISVLYVTSA